MQVVIEKIDHLGRGITKINGKTTFIDKATIGDFVDIEIINDKKNYSIGKIKNIINYSKYRKKDCCKYYNKCGGCSLGCINYTNEITYKQDKIKNIITRYLKEDIKINPIIYAKDKNYRNKITLHVKNSIIGLYESSSNNIISIDECHLVDNNINKIIKRLKKLLNENSNDIKKIVVKSTNLNEALIAFYGNINEDVVLNEFSDIKSIFINGKALKDKYIKDTIGDNYFLLSENSFFQINKYNTINLYNEVIRLIKDKKIENALDLYCGTGTIGILASKYVKKLTGIEIIVDAVDSANLNKKLNNIYNIDFINGKVEDYIYKFKNIDLIITDPPRSGMDKITITNILKINPKYIVYVSCDPMTFTRDLNILKEKYNIVEISPVDMFPNTHHVEAIALLQLK